MFVDEVKVYAQGGHGGKGCVAFHREAFVPKGGPSGGNGGRGGDVILEADHDLNNLIAQFYQPRLIAGRGQGGLGKGMDGRAGQDLLVKVPCGTLVWRLSETGAPTAPVGVTGTAAAELARGRMRHGEGGLALEVDLTCEVAAEEAGSGAQPRGELVADLTEHGQRFVLCQGGRGGLGNRHFATATRQVPRFAQPGEPGEEGAFLFELRLMADAGLVGYPNAGKSTLLAAISRARPKIAPYPFTTLHPQIGILEYEDYGRLIVCDVPGLIEGAHHNAGLGHKFLRHVQRCKILVLILDMAGIDGRRPWEDYRQLLTELRLYDAALLTRPRLVVANKMDEPAGVANLKTFKRKVPKVPVLLMAAAFDEGIAEFKERLRQAVQTARGH